jgi:hypothetical protein
MLEIRRASFLNVTDLPPLFKVTGVHEHTGSSHPFSVSSHLHSVDFYHNSISHHPISSSSSFSTGYCFRSLPDLIHTPLDSFLTKTKTTHLTSFATFFNPFARHAKTPRLVLSLLPPAALSSVKVTVKQLPRSNNDPSTLEIGFKDGKVLKYQFQEPVPGQTGYCQAKGCSGTGGQALGGPEGKEELTG